MSQLFTLKSPEKYGKQFLLISAGFPKVSITCVEPPSSLIQVRAEAERREREEEMRRRQAEEEKRRRALAWNGGGKQWPDLYFFDDVLSPDWISSNNIHIIIQLPLQYFCSGHMKTKNRVGCVCCYCRTFALFASHDRWSGKEEERQRKDEERRQKEEA